MGHRLSIARMDMKRGQRELAQFLNISQQTLSAIESGKTAVSERFTMARLLAVLGDKRFGFVMTGAYASQFDLQLIKQRYWEFTLKTTRENRKDTGNTGAKMFRKYKEEKAKNGPK